MSKYVVYKTQEIVWEQLVEASSYEEAEALARHEDNDQQWELYDSAEPTYSGCFAEWANPTQTATDDIWTKVVDIVRADTQRLLSNLDAGSK